MNRERIVYHTFYFRLGIQTYQYKKSQAKSNYSV